MPKFHVEYAQTELRTFSIEATNLSEARTMVEQLHEEGLLPAGRFSQAFDPRPLSISEGGTTILF